MVVKCRRVSNITLSHFPLLLYNRENLRLLCQYKVSQRIRVALDPDLLQEKVC